MAFDWAAVAQAGGSLINGIISHFDQQEMTRLQNNLGRDQLALSRENLAFNRDVADRNFAQQQAAFQYQKELNNMQMAREDNAMQRRVEDLRKAGLSPLMASEGAQAGNLLAGNAPQYDVSGINNAVQGVQSARQDYQTRLFNQAQFKLQSKLQIAQLSADLMDAMQQYQKNKLDYEYQKGLNDYVATNGYRNLNWQNELIQLLSKLTGGFNPSGIKDKVSDTISLGKNEFNNLIQDFSNLVNLPKMSEGSTLFDKVDKFRQYGIVNPKSKYGHTLDDENYDNNRPTGQLIKEELAEKYYKSQLKRENDDVTAGKLWETDDYLKKHISKDDWLKTDWEFRKFYLKNGYFK